MEYNMKKILSMFNKCNRFSLTCALPITEIPVNDKNKLSQKNIDNTKKDLLAMYNHNITKASKLPKFDIVFDDILKECSAFYDKIRGKDLLLLCKRKNSPYICDHVGVDTIYKEPLEIIWHFYNEIQHMIMANDESLKIKECDKLNIENIFTNMSDITLKNNFESYEFTYSTHCTRGPLQLVLYFPLNNDTKEWLLQFKDDYEINKTNFEDLALYCDDKLEFSSCTHENYNSLDSNIL